MLFGSLHNEVLPHLRLPSTTISALDPSTSKINPNSHGTLHQFTSPKLLLKLSIYMLPADDRGFLDARAPETTLDNAEGRGKPN